MKRIVIFSDSLALPRRVPEITMLEDTYPYMLRSKYDVFQCSIGGCLIRDLHEQTDYYCQYNPDIVIIQSGVVDCGPRAFSKFTYEFLCQTIIGKVIRRLIKYTITSKRIRNWRRISWTSEKKYRAYLKKFKNEFPNSKVYAISILPVSENYEKTVPGMKKKTEIYNRILREEMEDRLIDVSGIPFNGIMSDGHHLTKQGHKYVYEMIIKYLSD